MLKILLIEDILEKADAIKRELSEWNIQIFHSARAFLNHMQYSHLSSTPQNQPGDFLKDVDIFLLDFNLGDGNIINTNIYQTILEEKKESALMCCISSYPPALIEDLCRSHAFEYNRERAFDIYLKKDAKFILQFIQKCT